MLGTEQVPRADKDIDKKKSDDSYELTEAERKGKTQAGKWQCILKFCSCHVRSYLMTWSPWQEQQNSQIDAQEMQGKD